MKFAMIFILLLTCGAVFSQSIDPVEELLIDLGAIAVLGMDATTGSTEPDLTGNGNNGDYIDLPSIVTGLPPVYPEQEDTSVSFLDALGGGDFSRMEVLEAAHGGTYSILLFHGPLDIEGICGGTPCAGLFRKTSGLGAGYVDTDSDGNLDRFEVVFFNGVLQETVVMAIDNITWNPGTATTTMIALTVDLDPLDLPGDARLYINGDGLAEQVDVTLVPTDFSDVPWLIGNLATGGLENQNSGGAIDAVGIFHGTVLTEEEIENVYLSSFAGEPMLRGDVSGNGAVDISDGILANNFLFLGGTVACEESVDFNDDDVLDSADSIGIFTFAFVPGSPPPASPYPLCGFDSSGIFTCSDGGSCD